MRNRISYLQFQKALSFYEIFSIKDILKIYPDFDSRRLNEWQKKNYITKLIKGWYIFNDIYINENSLFQISNSLRSPSYISLESALSFHHIIPEQSFTITAITTLKTIEYNTPKGIFSYKTIKPNLFFGYKIIPQKKGRSVLMAENRRNCKSQFLKKRQLMNKHLKQGSSLTVRGLSSHLKFVTLQH